MNYDFQFDAVFAAWPLLLRDTWNTIELIRNTPFLVQLFFFFFARSVADRVIFMAEGKIVEQAPPQEFFSNPQNETTRNFLGQILSSQHQH